MKRVDPGASLAELEELAQSLEHSLQELSGSEEKGVLASINGHIQRYLAFYAIISIWALAMALFPLRDRDAATPASAQTGSPAAALPSADTPPPPGSLPSGPARAAPAGSLGSAADVGGTSVEAPDIPTGSDDEDGDGSEGDEEFTVVPPAVEEDVLQTLSPVIQALGQFYDEATPVWDAGNEGIGLLVPVLVDIALALGPVMAIVATVGGGDLRAACENLGLVGTVFGVVSAGGILPPVAVVSLALPAFILCGFVFDEVPEDAPALILDNVDLPI